MPLPPYRPGSAGNPNRKPGFSIYWMYALVAIFLIGVFYLDDNSVNRNVPYSKFETIMEQGGASKLIVNTDKRTAEAVLTDAAARQMYGNSFKPGEGAVAKVSTNIASVEAFSRDLEKWKQNHVFNGEVNYETSGSFSSILWAFGPIVLLIVFWFFIMKRMGSGGGAGSVFSVGKSKAQLFDKNNANKVTFKDVAGLSEAKTEVEEIVSFLKDPKRYTTLGGKIPKGAILVGPPGTGKTLLAKAVAGEADVPFFSLSGSDFVEMFVGVGASRVRDLFRQAKEKAPCIVFIDEIDAVGRARGRNPGMGTNDERENTLNQLLTEMDGFGTNSGVICLAATNRVDVLDKALLRPGRFDRQIFVELPDINDRVAIFNVHIKGKKIDSSVDIELLARQTPGFSGADIANVCNEAALIAARANKDSITALDFNAAIDRIIGGLEKKNKITTADEKRGIAIHEAGHATVSWHLQYGDPLVKVTIVPRGKAMGAAWYMPEERQLVPAQALLDKICSLMAGRAAEDIFIGQVATGALNDLERATKIAYSLVTFYGMSDRLPNVSYYDSSGQNFNFQKPYSEERARIIDEEVSAIIAAQYQRAKDILLKYKDGARKLADELFEREVIFTNDVEAIFGPRQWTSRTEEIMAMNKNDEAPVTDNDDKRADSPANINSDINLGVTDTTKTDDGAEASDSDTANTDTTKTADSNPGGNTSVTPPPFKGL